MTYMVEPKGISMEVGCKVKWRTYATEEEAVEASKVAAHNRELDLARGYDFGYCWPGSITKTDEGWRVCFS